MKFRDIKQFIPCYYSVTICWDHLEETLKRYTEGYNLDLDPEFQRAHVWTEDKQIKYVEFIMKNGQSSRNVYFNCPNWMSRKEPGQMVLVDGKQRLEAVRRFLNNEIPAFNTLCKDFEGRMPMDYSFTFHVNNLSSHKEVLQWYLDLNSGGVVHTEEELDKVRKMLEAS